MLEQLRPEVPQRAVYPSQAKSKVTSSKERHKIFMAVNNNSGCCAGINFEGWAPIAGNGSGKVLVVSVRYNAVVTCSYKGDTHVSTLWTEIIDNG